MIALEKKKPGTSEQGFALILALLTLLLISAALMGMFIMSNTETNVSANFRDEQTAYFASKAGIEEVRDRMRGGATNSLSGNLPTALPGAANGILYVTNPAAGETVAPWLTTGTNYPDDEICKEVTCTGGVPTGTWYIPTPASASTSYAAAPILTWKWVRVMAKANKSDTGATRVTSVDGTINGNRVCWNGSNEFTTTAASCFAFNPTANFQPVYELTALAVTPSGSRRMRQYEASKVTLPGIPGAFVFDGQFPQFNPPSSSVFSVSGTDAAQGPNAGVGCTLLPGQNNVPALGAYDNLSVATLDGVMVGPPDRSGQYTSSAPYATTPAVASVNSSLSSGAIDLTTVDGLRKLVTLLTSAAGGNVYGASPLPSPSAMNVGTNTSPVINVVNGDYTYTGSGAGILLVTGQLTLNGNFNYNGLILAIGEGAIIKSGGGGGTVNGAMFAANLFSDTPPPGPYTHPIATGHPGIPYFSWSGGGNATIQYDSCWINAVNQGLPFRLVAQRELIY
jgi:Tfp pilus assembly protein PilX